MKKIRDNVTPILYVSAISIILIITLPTILFFSQPAHAQSTEPSVTQPTNSPPPAGSTVSRTSTSCVRTQVGNPTGPAPALPAVCTSRGNTSDTGGVPTAGDYYLPLNKVDILGITTEMGTYGGNFIWEGHTEHAGLDINTEDGASAPVYGVADGVIEGVYAGGGEVDILSCINVDAGCTVRVVHNDDDLTTWYTHIDPTLRTGQPVKKGEKLGTVHVWPNPNDHLHLELRETETNQNIQPRNYFPDLQIFPVSESYNGNIRTHSAQRGIELLDDGREFAERFKFHPPCQNEPYAGWCWAF